MTVMGNDRENKIHEGPVSIRYALSGGLFITVQGGGDAN
jgi:hypothetical protein